MTPSLFSPLPPHLPICARFIVVHSLPALPVFVEEEGKKTTKICVGSFYVFRFSVFILP